MKLFLEVAETGKYELLVKKGVANADRLSNAWESIMKQNELHTGNNALSTYMELSQDNLILINEHTIIKSSLLILIIQPEHEMAFETLAEYGYHINKKNIMQSIMDCMNNSNNIITHIQLKQREIEVLTEEEKHKSVTFEDLIADTSFHLRFQIPNDITLAQFNAYRKTLKRKSNGRNREDREE